MEYCYYAEWDDEKDAPKKIYKFDKGVNDPHPEKIYDEDLKKEVKVKMLIEHLLDLFIKDIEEI